MPVGHVTVGAVVSFTVTEKLHCEELPPASVAVQVTVVVPTGNVEPEAGTHATVAVPQSSLAVGTANVTTAEQALASAWVTTSAGQEIVGAAASVTVTENAHCEELKPPRLR